MEYGDDMCTDNIEVTSPWPPSVAFWNGWADGRLWCPFSLARFFLAPKTLSLGHLELLSLVTTEPLTVFKHVH